LQVNVTDTASAAASLLMDLQVGGVRRLSVRKDGRLFFGTNGIDAIWTVGGRLQFTAGGAGPYLGVQASGVIIQNSASLSFSSSPSPGDTILVRDGAANTLAQRNGTAAQESRIYGTYTGPGNYRRLALKMSSAGVAQIVAEGAGSGAADNRLEFVTGGATRMTVAADGGITTKSNLTLETPAGFGSGVITVAMGNSPSLRLTQSTGNKLVINPGDGNISRSNSANVPINLSFQASGGNVGIGTTSPAERLDVVGNIKASGSITGGDCVLSGKLELNTVTRVSFGPQTSGNPMLVRRGDALLGCRTGTNASDASFSCSNLTASGTIKTGGYAFADLPTSPTTGMRAYITDGAASPAYMDNAAGGGTTVTPVFYDGTNWINA
jgi:hypothetical protein